MREPIAKSQYAEMSYSTCYSSQNGVLISIKVLKNIIHNFGYMTWQRKLEHRSPRTHAPEFCQCLRSSQDHSIELGQISHQLRRQGGDEAIFTSQAHLIELIFLFKMILIPYRYLTQNKSYIKNPSEIMVRKLRQNSNKTLVSLKLSKP